MTACERKSTLDFPALSSKYASLPVKATKFFEEGSRAAGFGHLGLFSKIARMGRVSGWGDAEIERVGKIVKQCPSLSTEETVPEPVTLAGILQAPSGSSGGTVRGLN